RGQVSSRGEFRAAVPAGRNCEVDVLVAEQRLRQQPGTGLRGDGAQVAGLDPDGQPAASRRCLDFDDLADAHAAVLHGRVLRHQPRGGGYVGGYHRIALESPSSLQNHQDGGEQQHCDGDRSAPEELRALGGRRLVRAHRTRPGRLGCNPQIEMVSSTSVMVMVTMLVRSARPAALPTPSGPPVAWKPYAQCTRVTSTANTVAFSSE